MRDFAIISAFVCATLLGGALPAQAATPAPDADTRITIRVEPAPASATKAKLLPASATRAVVKPATATVKMDTVLRCREGVCLQVSTKTAVSGSEPVTDD